MCLVGYRERLYLKDGSIQYPAGGNAVFKVKCSPLVDRGNVIFHHYNVRLHADTLIQKNSEIRWHSLDLAASDFYMFPFLGNYLGKTNEHNLKTTLEFFEFKSSEFH